MENWRPIPGYEGIYEASDCGNIRSAPGKTTSSARFQKRVWKTRVLKPKAPINARRHDYRVTLWKDGEKSDHLVARLVAMAWHGVPEVDMTVNHINGNYHDNRAENLEWVTASDNIKHGFATGLFSGIQKKITIMDSAGNVKVFPSMAETDRFLGRKVGYTSLVIKRDGRLKAADGTLYAITGVGGKA